MAAITLTITDAGRNEIARHQALTLGPVFLSQVGLGSGTWSSAPTSAATSLNTEVKRLTPDATAPLANGTIHIVASDKSGASYDCTEIGIYTDTGVLFAIYGQATKIFSKASSSVALVAADIIITGAPPSSVSIGDASFGYPEATISSLGVVYLATQDQVDAGTGALNAVTSSLLAQQHYLKRANNLSDIANVALGRTNLGLGTAAVKDVSGTPDIYGNTLATRAQVVMGSDTRLTDQRTPLDASVSPSKLMDAAVTNPKLAPTSISSDKLMDQSVTNPKLAAASISSDKLMDQSVSNPKLAAASISSDKLMDQSVTGPKLAASSVSSDKLIAGSVGYDKLSSDALAQIRLYMLKALYPVGEIFITHRSGNPYDILGFGNWDRYGSGRTLVSVDPGDTDFNGVDKVGGEKSHTLLTSEMPAHTHTTPALTTGSAGNHAHTYYQPYVETDGANTPASQGGNTNFHTVPVSAVTSSVAAHTHTVPASVTGSTVGDQPHNNMPPYITVNMWIRKPD